MICVAEKILKHIDCANIETDESGRLCLDGDVLIIAVKGEFVSCTNNPIRGPVKIKPYSSALKDFISKATSILKEKSDTGLIYPNAPCWDDGVMYMDRSLDFGQISRGIGHDPCELIAGCQVNANVMIKIEQNYLRYCIGCVVFAIEKIESVHEGRLCSAIQHSYEFSETLLVDHSTDETEENSDEDPNEASEHPNATEEPGETEGSHVDIEAIEESLHLIEESLHEAEETIGEIRTEEVNHVRSEDHDVEELIMWITSAVQSPDSDEICAISHEPLRECDSVLQINLCGHKFRELSIRTWLQTNRTCPVCRRVL